MPETLRIIHTGVLRLGLRKMGGGDKNSDMRWYTEDVLRRLGACVTYANATRAHLLCLTGPLFDSPDVDARLAKALYERLSKISTRTDILIMPGPWDTPLLAELGNKRKVMILATDQPRLYKVRTARWPELLVATAPRPTWTWRRGELTSGSFSQEQRNEMVAMHLEDDIAQLAAEAMRHDCPAILLGCITTEWATTDDGDVALCGEEGVSPAKAIVHDAWQYIGMGWLSRYQNIDGVIHCGSLEHIHLAEAGTEKGWVVAEITGRKRAVANLYPGKPKDLARRIRRVEANMLGSGNPARIAISTAAPRIHNKPKEQILDATIILSKQTNQQTIRKGLTQRVRHVARLRFITNPDYHLLTAGIPKTKAINALQRMRQDMEQRGLSEAKAATQLIASINALAKKIPPSPQGGGSNTTARKEESKGGAMILAQICERSKQGESQR